MLLSGCSEEEYSVSEVALERATRCLALEKSRHDLKVQIASLAKSDDLKERDIIAIAHVMERGIEQKNQCLRTYTDQILKTDELSNELSDYLSDISTARSLIVVTIEEGYGVDDPRVREALEFAMKYIGKDDV
jgi:hypothetical protein